MMCASAADLRERSGWLGVGDASRRQLLESLQREWPSAQYHGRRSPNLYRAAYTYLLTASNPTSNHIEHIPASVMIPQRRLETLLEQAKEHQRASCRYHTSDPTNFSLFSDHVCDRNVFPTVNTHILDAHSHEVWRIAFSNAGELLASASEDGTVMIWNVKVSLLVSTPYTRVPPSVSRGL